MSIFKSVNNGTGIIVTCDCGCDEGLRFKVDKLNPDCYCIMTYTNGAFYREQNDTVWKGISKKLKKIWAIIRNKDYYYSEIIMTKEEFDDFRKYLIMVDILDEHGDEVLNNLKEE